MRRKEWDGGATIIVGGQGPGVLMPWELSSQWVEAATGTSEPFPSPPERKQETVPTFSNWN